ncbi:MAG TPA: alpha/beta hydrolase-fold protein [Blastocatellia bacterium]|jgi:S-formylglutathione hydrolase
MRQKAILILFFIFIAAESASASQLIEARVETRLVPGPVEYAVLLPDSYEKSKDLPLLFFLHGGGGDKSFLARMRPVIDEMWKAGTLPPMVIVTPSAARSFYMDYKDGTQKWESFIVTEFLDHLRAKYKVTRERKGTMLFGISMGGMGTLRLGFKHPEKFGALAAMEPGIDPVLKWRDLSSRYKFYRGQNLMETIFGKPFDEAYWEANNVATIAVNRADKLRAAGQSIYIEAGDEDMFYLHEATEFLHRILWDQKIPHEYHLVRGADHVGSTIGRRAKEALEFLARTLAPPQPDPEVEAARKRLEPLKRAVEKR